MRLFAADIETDGLDATKIWVWSVAELDPLSMKVLSKYNVMDYEKMQEMAADKNSCWIIHNGADFDIPTLSRILGVEVRGRLIDTLIVSWYLYPQNLKPGLASWGEQLGYPKPVVADGEWLGLPRYKLDIIDQCRERLEGGGKLFKEENYLYQKFVVEKAEHLELMVHRCESDVVIQTKLWQQMWKHLLLLYNTPEGAWHCVDYLTFKMECAYKARSSRWKLDHDLAHKELGVFRGKYAVAKIELGKGMPENPVYDSKSRPKKPYKMNGELSATGLRWKAFCEPRGIDFDSTESHKYVVGHKEPNAGSYTQLKNWLFSLGWVPETFKYKRDKETNKVRKIPQLKIEMTGELCPSVAKLIPKDPAIEYLGEMGIVKHRGDILNTWVKNEDEEGFVYAGIQGLTNTLRFKHKICLNIPSNRKPYGEVIRSCLMARSDRFELCGADLDSLEDRTKQHYMWPHDPEYVKDMMQDDFDPHVDMCISAGTMNKEQGDAYKAEDFSEWSEDYLGGIRHGGKTTNYAATYGAVGLTVARAGGFSEDLGNKLVSAYWVRNWSVKAIADECEVKQSRKMKWLWNPVAELWVHLKTDKDRFSTLNQSTASYCFDMWIKKVLEKRDQITGQFHDEGIFELLKGNREGMEKILNTAIAEVTTELELNRELTCGIKFGDNYAKVH